VSGWLIYPQWKNIHYPFDRRQSRSHTQSGLFGKEKNLLLLSGIRTHILHFPAYITQVWLIKVGVCFWQHYACDVQNEWAWSGGMRSKSGHEIFTKVVSCHHAFNQLVGSVSEQYFWVFCIYKAVPWLFYPCRLVVPFSRMALQSVEWHYSLQVIVLVK
jgi:hypothetical protein